MVVRHRQPGMTETACGPRELDTFVRLDGGIDVPESCFMFAPPKSSNQRITTSTFSRDIARLVSRETRGMPAASAN
jgi:hypothetical protein